MANIKISQLPAASAITPGTDVVPIVHSGTTQKATPNQIVNAILASPGSIGSDVPGAGTFTALVSTSTTILNGTTVPAGKNLVTTNDTQTLTGKTINLATNIVTGTISQFNTACSDGNFLTDTGSATLYGKTINLATNIVTGTISQFNMACSNADFATLSGSEVLNNKTINLASNTLTGTLAEFNTACSDGNFLTDTGSAALFNKTINLASNTLTGTLAEFNMACSNADFATLFGSEVLNNKTINANGHIKSSSSVSGVGYDTGAGSTVTQDTNRTNAVTINNICGQITTVSATATAGTFVTFTVYNSAVSSTDTVIANLAGIGFSGNYILNVVNVRSGNFKIQTYTPSAVISAEALVINFSVIKSVNA